MHLKRASYVSERWKSELQVVVNVSGEALDVQGELRLIFAAKIVASVDSKHTGQRHVYKICFLISEMTLSCRGGAAEKIVTGSAQIMWRQKRVQMRNSPLVRILVQCSCKYWHILCIQEYFITCFENLVFYRIRIKYSRP